MEEQRVSPLRFASVEMTIFGTTLLRFGRNDIFLRQRYFASVEMRLFRSKAILGSR